MQIDFSAAFDRVNHSDLFFKLHDVIVKLVLQFLIILLVSEVVRRS